MITRETNQSPNSKPRVFYGYIVVVAAFFIFLVSFGLYYSFGVFLPPLLTEFGWTRAVTSGAFSLSLIISGVLSVVMGGLNDRFGPRVVVTLCGFLFSLGHFLMSQISAQWQIYLFYGVLIGIGMGGIWVPLLSTIARWFVRRRSMMTGIAASGIGIGGLIAAPLISRLITAFDWRLSYIMVGSIALLVMVLTSQFLKRDPISTGQLPYGGNEGGEKTSAFETNSFSLKLAVQTTQFRLVFVMFFSIGFSIFSVTVHIVPHAIEMGISAVSAANILAVMSGMSIIGTYVLGGVGDRMGNRWIYIIGCIMMSAALFWLVPAKEVWMLYLFGVVNGFALGMGVGESPLIAELFGLSSHGLILGVAHLGFTIGGAVGPVVTGHIFDITGGYQPAFLVSAVFCVFSTILVSIIRPTKKLGAGI